MGDEQELLGKIRDLVRRRKYRVRLHAVRHMVEEGFGEEDMTEAVAGERSVVLEHYPDDFRCLALGYFTLGERAASPLHVVCDYSQEAVVDLVTADIPQKPWWLTPTKRGGIR
jgi:hypothetical protein